MVYCICANALLCRPEKTRFTHLLLGYTTILCILNCIYTGANASGLQQTFIDNRNYPGGPWGYVTTGILTAPFNLSSECSYFLANLMADALLVHLVAIGTPALYWLSLPVMALQSHLGSMPGSQSYLYDDGSSSYDVDRFVGYVGPPHTYPTV